MRHLIGTALTILICSPTAAENQDEPQGWISIFDGKSLAGWKPNERPKNWVVEDGAIVGRGARRSNSCRGMSAVSLLLLLSGFGTVLDRNECNSDHPSLCGM